MNAYMPLKWSTFYFSIERKETFSFDFRTIQKIIITF